MSADAQRTLLRLYDAVRSRDLEAVAAFFSEGCEFVDVPTDSTVRGLDGFRGYMTETWRSFPDFAPEAEPRFFEAPTGVAADLWIGGTHEGEFAGVAPTGRRIRWRAAAFYDFDAEGLIERETYIYDQLSILRALGAAS